MVVMVHATDLSRHQAVIPFHTGYDCLIKLIYYLAILNLCIFDPSALKHSKSFVIFLTKLKFREATFILPFVNTHMHTPNNDLDLKPMYIYINMMLTNLNPQIPTNYPLCSLENMYSAKRFLPYLPNFPFHHPLL